MRIRRIDIANYRSIKRLSISCGPTVVLLGPNNHGKSNVLAALEFFFSSSAKPKSADFFANREEDSLWVDLVFEDLSDQEARTFEKYVGSDGTLRIRKTATLADGSVAVSYNGWTSEPAEEWLRSEYAAAVKKADLIPELERYLPAEKRFSKAAVLEAQQAFIRDHRDQIVFNYALEEGPLLGQKNVAAGTLPDAFLVPAVRDLTEETKAKGTTLFGRLLGRALGEMTESDPDFRQMKHDLAGLIARLNKVDGEDDRRPPQLRELEQVVQEELAGWQVTLDIKVAPPEIEKLFELGTSIHVFDGVSTPAEQKGHGLQRALIFALTRAWAASLVRRQNDAAARARAASTSIFLLVEEPELYLHPHAQRRLAQSLRHIGQAPHHQVILCSHSPHFVDMEAYRSIAILHKQSVMLGTTVKQCREDVFAGEDAAARKARFNIGHWLNPERAELFFARRVVFVEGATEKVLIPYLAQRMGIFDPEVSVIDCGSKFNLAMYAKLAGAFGLDFVVVHDEDPVKDGLEGDSLKAAQNTFHQNAIIDEATRQAGGIVKMLAPEFESCCGVSKSQGEKKGKPLAALDHFSSIEPDNIPQPLRDLVAAIYCFSGIDAAQEQAVAEAAEDQA